MKYKVYWKEIKFLEIEKINDMYHSEIITENVDKVAELGYPKTFINDIKEVDKELPKIVSNRLPDVNYLNEKGYDTKDIEKAIGKYINDTKCRRITDYISIEVEE
ncbi:MAG: hypothetical protein J6A15_09760 [Clostridia bacterium]|nr:hypothetical protein [Clostridia bacterium]